jgi:hypothetical protein
MASDAETQFLLIAFSFAGLTFTDCWKARKTLWRFAHLVQTDEIYLKTGWNTFRRPPGQA